MPIFSTLEANVHIRHREPDGLDILHVIFVTCVCLYLLYVFMLLFVHITPFLTIYR